MSVKMIIANLNLLYSPLCFSASWHWLCLNNHNQGQGGGINETDEGTDTTLGDGFTLLTRDSLVITGNCCHHCLEEKLGPRGSQSFRYLAEPPAAAGAKNTILKIQFESCSDSKTGVKLGVIQ